jgi:hypothetical protein
LARHKRGRAATWLRYLIGLALGGVALYAVSGQRGELTGVGAELDRLNAGFVALAVAAEIASFVAFSRMQARLLRAGNVVIGPGRVLGITAAASAIASSIPGGPAVATVYAYRQYRRVGANESISGWALAATLLCSALGLTLVAGAGVLLAEKQGAALDLVDVTAVLLIITLLAMAVFTQRSVLVAMATALLRGTKRLTGYPKRDVEDLISEVGRHLGQVHLTWRIFGPAVAWSLLNWALDCGCLALGYTAVAAGIPWRGLLLAYGAGQLASNLPITPGGLGVVEGSLTVALVAYGGVEASTVAAVILYRIISFWGFLPVGWMTWGLLAIIDKRSDRRKMASEPPTSAGGEPPDLPRIAADGVPA